MHQEHHLQHQQMQIQETAAEEDQQEDLVVQE
jgi:hypothetical protein